MIGTGGVLRVQVWEDVCVEVWQRQKGWQVGVVGVVMVVLGVALLVALPEALLVALLAVF